MITRPVDQNNRIVLPANLINAVFHPQPNEELRVDFFIEDDAIIVKKHEPKCICCRTHNNLSKFKNIVICSECLKELIELQK